MCSLCPAPICRVSRVQSVHTASEKLGYDYLIIASGSDYPRRLRSIALLHSIQPSPARSAGPIKPASNELTLQTRQAGLLSWYERIRDAESVFIIGG